MTLPASGTISLSNVNTEIGSAATTARDLAWVKANTKDSVSNLGALYKRAYYKRNMDGNCNNGNCQCSNCNCGNCACSQCSDCNCNCPSNCIAIACGNINCANCDTHAWLQTGSNCACTYNCYNWNCFTTGSYACFNCACK